MRNLTGEIWFLKSTIPIKENRLLVSEITLLHKADYILLTDVHLNTLTEGSKCFK